MEVMDSFIADYRFRLHHFLRDLASISNSSMRPLARGNDDSTALLQNLVELRRKPNQNSLLDEIVKTLLEPCTGLDDVALPLPCRRSRV